MPFDLRKEVEKVLPPSSSPYELLNVQSKPRESKSAIHKPSKHKPAKSIKIEHLFTLFTNKTPILALEILVYVTISDDYSKVERLIYVSKADTTGLTPQVRVKTRAVIQCFLRWLLLYPIKRYFKDLQIKQELDYDTCITKSHKPFVSPTHRVLHILIERAKGDSHYGMPISKNTENQHGNDGKINTLLNDLTKQITQIVLFTRAEPQYLFPNSDRNESKHILTDSQLLKWWMNTINGIFNEFTEVLQKKLIILNSEVPQIKKFFPAESASSDTAPWNVGDIYTNNENMHDTAVYHIPLLPDDPKGRFLEHLVVENRIKKVKVRQFWTELSIRQEFRLGIIVGLIGIEGITKNEFGEEFVKGLTIVKKPIFKKIKKIMTEVDYSDSNEEHDKLFHDLQDELEDKIDGPDWISEIEVKHFANSLSTSGPSSTSPVNPLNILNVHSRKSAIIVDGCHVASNPVNTINVLNVRSKKNSSPSSQTPSTTAAPVINILSARPKKRNYEPGTTSPNSSAARKSTERKVTILTSRSKKKQKNNQ